MTRGQKIAAGIGGTIGGLLLLVLIGVLIVTQTRWGREQVRHMALEQLRGATDGEVEIGRMEGDLLRRIRLIDVAIRDEQGRPFLVADTLSTRYSLLSLIRQRIVLTDTRLVNAHVVLDEPPGEDWNYVRIFRLEPRPEVMPPRRPGWGDWIRFRDVELANVTVTIRSEWMPEDGLTPAERERAVREALEGNGRADIVRVAGGFQNVMDFRDLTGRLPQVIVADPDIDEMVFDIETLAGVAQPFRPPAAEIRDLAARITLTGDSLRFREVRAALPGSVIEGRGAYDMKTAKYYLDLRGEPVALDDLRWLYPPLPEEGGGSLHLALQTREFTTAFTASEMDLRTGGSGIAGTLSMVIGDTLRFRESDVALDRFDTRLLERLLPNVDLPIDGRMTGRIALLGPPESLDLDANVAFDDRGGGVSRVVAEGGIAMGEEVAFRDLYLRFDPLRVELVRDRVPQLPRGGALTGVLRLDGPPADLLQVNGDLVLRDPRTGTSRVLADGGIDMRDELAFREMHLRFLPLRVELVREQLPQLPAGGTLAGDLRLNGSTAGLLSVDGDLSHQHPTIGRSRVAARGGLSLGEETAFRDLRLRFDPLQTELVRAEVPQLPAGATLTGEARLDGRPAGPIRLDADLTLRDPASGVSRVAAAGGIDPRGEHVRFDGMQLRFTPLQTDLLRPEVPQVPAGATLAGDLRLDGSTGGVLGLAGDLRLTDPATGISRVVAEGGVRVEDELLFRDLRLRLDPLHLDLLRDQLPELPAGVVASGPLRLDGSPRQMLEVDGRLELLDPATGVNRVAASGGIGLGDPVRFRDLDLRFDPLRVDFARPFAPDLPIAGTLEGTATLDGSPATRLLVRGDLVHREAGERSHVAGRAEIAPGGHAAVDLRLMPLSLEVAGRFAPQAGLRGQVDGRLQASGAMADLTLQADLTAQDGGRIAAAGWLDLESDRPGYDLRATLADFDLAAVTRRAPARTSLTGPVHAEGRGVDPATMRADVRADLAGPRVDGLAADSVRLRLSLARGLAEVTDTRVQLATADASLDGTFGLVAGQYGELRYQVRVDSLHPLAPYVPGADTAVVQPRPAVRQAALEQVAEEEARAEGRREIERLATGREPPPPTPIDTAGLATLPQDSLAGSLHAAGTLRGNVERFDLIGNARVRDFVYQGNSIGFGDAEYTLLGLGGARPAIDVDAELEEVQVQGFAFDSASVRVEHRGLRVGEGRAVVAAYQDDRTDFRLDADFALSLDRNELLFRDLDLRFDTVTWRSVQPGAVSWDGRGVELRTIELVSNTGGRVFLDGDLPVEGSADLEVVIDRLPLDHVVSLLQDEQEATGVLSLRAEVQGTLASPVFEGEGSLLRATHDGRELPDVRASFAYAGAALTLDATLHREAVELGRVEGSLPIDLALAGREGPRLIGGEVSLDVRADSIPLEALPSFTDQVSDVRGRVQGEFTVRGTFQDPVLDGFVDLDLGSLRVEATGVRYEEIVGTLRMTGETIVVDSLVAWNGGPIRVTGEIDVATLAEPVFDLQLRATEAQVLDDDQGRLWVDAALEIAGPLAALEVGGVVRTHRGVFYIPESRGQAVVDLDDPDIFEGIDPMLAAEREALFRPSPLLAGLRVDVELFIAPETWVRSTDANVEVYTDPEIGPLDVRYDGRNGRLSIEGTVNTDRGEYSFLGRRFQITRGAATFMGGGEFDPLIQIAAEHEVRMPGREALEIRIVLGGTALEPTITLESTARPPLSQTDLLSLVAFGRGASSLMVQQGSSLGGQGASGGELTGNVAGLAVRQLGAVAANTLLKEFESDAARALGLDVFHITPADLPAELFTGRFDDLLRGTRIEAGSYIGRRLFAAGHARPTLETRPGARVEYRSPGGFIWRTSWEPRFLPAEPTLQDRDPDRTSVFGVFLRREWRF
jgi:translocation and assembly module TamB